MAEKDIGDRAIGRMGGRSGGDSAGGDGAHGVEGLRHEAAGIGREARGAVEDSLSSARHMAADNVHRAAEALHAAAGNMGRGDTVGSLIDAAATRLDSASDALRGRDLGRLVQDVNAFARRQPALFIGGALLAGIALGRLATAGTGRSQHRGDHAYTDTTYGTTYGDEARTTAAVRGAPEPRQEGRLSGAIGGTRGDSTSGDPPTTIPGHQARGARPQPRGSVSGMPTDE